MRKRIFTKLAISMIAASVVTNSHAIANGFYLGLMMGPATNGSAELQAQVDNQNSTGPNRDTIETTPALPRSTQFGTRFFMGNRFNRYAALEGGLDFFSTVQYDTRDVATLGGANQRLRALDLGFKGFLPLKMFEVFGKVGVAASYLTKSSAFNATYNPNPDISPTTGTAYPHVSGSNTYVQKFSPTYGVGASLDLNQSWVVDLSYTTIQVGSSLGSMSMYTLGLSYHFTDKYCGQFLCDD